MAREFTFAGFNFPKRIPRLIKRRPWQHGLFKVDTAYYHSPEPNTKKEVGFYFKSDFEPGVRLMWFDTDYPDMPSGLVYKLPKGRGFLAGWTLGEKMSSGVERNIIAESKDAITRAMALAENIAEEMRNMEVLNGMDEDEVEDDF